MAAALENGHAALALTDHDSVGGSMEFAQAATALSLRALHGAEISLEDGRHLTLLVETRTGWHNLCRLLTSAHSQTRLSPAGLSAPAVTIDTVLAHAEGLICLTGCARHGVHDEPTVRRLLDGFGPSLRLELQRPYLRGDRERLRKQRALAGRLGVTTVATGGVHAHSRERAQLHDALIAIRRRQTLEESEPVRHGNLANALGAPAAMVARFAEMPEAVAETLSLSERLQFDLARDVRYSYPGAEDPDSDTRLVALCRARLDDRYTGRPSFATAEVRLDEELRVIRSLSLSGFFLLHNEVMELAKEVAWEVRGREGARSLLSPGRGRGSSVSSIVCFLLGLSHVDPIEAELSLGRFLHEEITSLPDIDMDFGREIRDVLLPRLHQHYGASRCSLVGAYATFRSRNSVREFGLALGLPAGEVERVARACGGGGDLADVAVAALGPERSQSGRWLWLTRLAAEAHRLPHHLTQHPGGMVISTRPLSDCCAVVPAAMPGRQILQWDKDSIADAGMLKIDLLGLGALSAVEKCVELLEQTRGESIDLSRISRDDARVYRTIQIADTVGVFQIESRAQMASLLRTRPASLDELTVQVALIRPGPIVGGAVNPYIERLQRSRTSPGYRVPYLHPSLEKPLRETLGVIIFQDQVLDVARAFAGFSTGEAEGLRRAMSKRRSEAAIAAYRERFIAGAYATHGVSDEKAQQVWAMVAGFAGFGFPKSHSAAFAVLAYDTAWLRAYYPVEYLAALMNAQPMGFYAPDSLVHDAQRRGLRILPVDITRSGARCTVEDGAVRIGLGYVLGVRGIDVEALVDERNRSGPWRSLEDLAARAGAGRPSLEQLAWAGACDRLVDAQVGSARRVVLWQLGLAATATTERNRSTQLALPLGLGSAPALRSIDAWDAVVADYGTTRLTLDHPLRLLRNDLKRQGAVSSRDLRDLRHRSRVRVGGLVIARQRPATANGITFMLLEDEHGTVNLIVPPPVGERDRLAVITEPLVLVEGVVERHAAAGGAINVAVRAIHRLRTPRDVDAEITRLREEPAGRSAEGHAVSDLRAVAPSVQHFAQGRRR